MAVLELHWLPQHRNLRAAEAVLKSKIELGQEQLATDVAQLANHRSDFLDTLRIDRLAKTAFKRAPEGWPTVRLALLGSCSMEHLLPSIAVAGIRRQLWITLFAGAFGQYRQEVMNKTSDLHNFDPNAVLLALQAGDIVQALPLGATREEVTEAVEQGVEGLVSLWQMVRSELGATPIQQSFICTEEPLFGNLDGLVPASQRAITDLLNQSMRAAASREGVLVLDLAHWAERHGRDAWFDPIRWHYAKQLVAPSAAVFYGDLSIPCGNGR
jgi:predicted enzyme involved in methoxymalonyl-ACP biosynthesis